MKSEPPIWARLIEALLYLLAILSLVLFLFAIVDKKSKAASQHERVSTVILNAAKHEIKTETQISLTTFKEYAAPPKTTYKPTVVSKMGKQPPEEIARITRQICAIFVENCSQALIIVLHESGFRPWAISPTDDYGLFQLNCRWQKGRVGGDCTKFLDEDINIRIARQIYNEQGWNPWTTKRFL